MSKKIKLGVAGKVRELRTLLGSRRTVVHVMGAASVTSLKRWERRECSPLLAHRKMVNQTYEDAKRMSRALKDKLHRDMDRERGR